MSNVSRFGRSVGCGWGILLLLLGFNEASAQESVCARVVIQIEQELTLEREGFEARLGITNGLPTSLENLQVMLNFADADGNEVGASTDAIPDVNGKFYYRVQTGYTSVVAVAASATAKVAYLIVPALGAAGDSPEGKLYYIGATLKYTNAGQEQTVVIAPDFIFVRPMPQLQLQYFLPGDVYGDDPFTPTVREPAVPFPLGVRVVNHSPFVTARGVKIQSGQPEIIDNDQGLLIAFQLLGCRVNNQPVQPSLLVNFGNVAPRRSAMASWDMTSSLSGSFVRFTAEISHAPEFGGALTSLIPEDAISTHRLIRQVFVDLPGRDNVPDFLASDTMTGEITAPKIYESDSDEVSQPVDYFAPASSYVRLTSDGLTATLAVDAMSSLMFVRVASPIAVDKLVRAVRSDGKVLPPTNAWIAKTRNGSAPWQYWLNLFDTGKAADQSYALSFIEPSAANLPPELKVIGGPSFTVAAGRTLSIGLVATDPDHTVPAISCGPLPFGATFNVQPGGQGLFTWTPEISQLGTFTIQFTATDGQVADIKNIFVQVVAAAIPTFKSWQQVNWPLTEDILVTGRMANPDGDQMNNLLEYALDSDPNRPDDTVLPVVGISTVNGLRYLTLTYRKRTGAMSLRYEVIASDDLMAPLANWAVQTQTESASQANLPAGLERVTVRDSVPIDSPHRYLRLRITETDIE